MSKRSYQAVPKPVTSDYSAPSGAVCVQLKIPDALVHLFLLQGVVALMTNAEFWDGPDDEKAAIAASWQAAYTETDWGSCMTPGEAHQNSEINLWGHEASVVTGNALLITPASTRLHNFEVVQTPPTNSSRLRWSRMLAAGAWSYSWLWHRRTNGGIVSCDAYPNPGSGFVSIFGSIDTRGGTLDNQFTRGTFTLTDSGMYDIEMHVIGTSSGSNFGNTFTLLQLWRTGD